MIRLSKALLFAPILLAVASAGEPDAFRGIDPAAGKSDEWEFRLSLYAPLVGLDGSSRVGPVTVPIDIGLDEITDTFDGGFVLAGEARKGKFSLIGDFIWLKVSDSLSPGPLSYTGARVEQTIADLVLGYQLYEDPCWTVDALVGGAYTGLEVDGDLTVFPPGPIVGPTTTYFGISEDWVDPFVGLRFRYRPSERWRVFGRIDYGGFGWVSDTYFQAILGAGYRLNEQVGIFAAYRYLMVDYEKASFAWDVDTSGPQLGVVFSF